MTPRVLNFDSFFEKQDNYLSRELNDGGKLAKQYKGKLHEVHQMFQDEFYEMEVFV